jgi:5-methylcytosine-specific restriction endonuclease McrA
MNIVVIVHLLLILLGVSLFVAIAIAAFRTPIRESSRYGQREPISAAVKREVWRRDEVRCRYCGSQEWLEYDHIVPVARGGPSTVRNVQLVCQSCNRKKGARLAP